VVFVVSLELGAIDGLVVHSLRVGDGAMRNNRLLGDYPKAY
jgi:hypothetical protein